MNGTGFGVAIAVQNTDPAVAHNAHVDGATVTVYYYEADTTPPSIAAVPDMPGNEATGATGVAVNFSLPSASDEGGIASESCSPASGSTFALGSTTVTCTARDTAGNRASSHFDIGVVDTTPPVITLTGGNLTLALGDAFIDPGYAAADIVDGTDRVSVGGDTVNTAVAGTYSITYNAVDTAGNRATQKTRVVTVLPAVGGAPQAITVGVPAPANAIYGSTFDVAASADSGLPVAIEASGACSGAGTGAATITVASGAGDCTVSYSQAGDEAYAPATGVTETVVAQKAPLTVTADAKSKTYGDSDPALTYAHGVFAGGDTGAVLSGALARAAGEEAGVYAIGQGTLSAGGNYAISFTGAEFVIDAAEPVQQPGNIGTGSSNGAPVGTYGVSVSGGEVLGAETSVQQAGNVGTGALTTQQIKALLEFLKAFGIDQKAIETLNTTLR